MSEPYEFNGMEIPAHMVESLEGWVRHAHKPGDFLTNVLCNDLAGAAAHADHTNRWLLTAYVGWLYNEAPGTCWGSPEKVAAWVERGGDPNWTGDRDGAWMT